MPKWRPMVRQILRRSSALAEKSDFELRKMSLALRFEALTGTPLEELLIEGFSLVREAARRTLGMEHYEVQLLGGIAMHYQSVIVMQTGEGKTLTASLPMYLNSLTDKGAHLVTANDYLAARDAELMRPVYELLGLNVGVVQSETSRTERHAAYRCDVTYSTAKEVGFDFLRDRILLRNRRLQGGCFVTGLMSNLAGSVSMDEPVQRGHHFVLVDEADSILIDEARTPLIVSSVPDEFAQAASSLYQWCARNSTSFALNEHYVINPQSKQLLLTPDGRKLVRKITKPKMLAMTPILDVYEQMEQAIYVDQNYYRDRHYIIRDGEVVIVDEFTGRLAEGRKWRSGIHQAIEAREGLKVSVETGEAARITIQDLFLKYDRLAGMTGTVGNSQAELRKIYDVKVVNVPTNKPPQREQWPDEVFGTEAQKWDAIADEIELVHSASRPVLIGTRSIDKSELLSKKLTDRKIEHQVLNARQLAEEASIVARAGEVGRVTVATNMAGRGTDIRVQPTALENGGLHVICTELHESARIDRQLIGRCGRQGDPGTYRQFMSFEDDLLKVALGVQRFERLTAYRSMSSARLKRFASWFRHAQNRIEKRHFKSRKILLHREKLRSELQHEMGQDPYLDVAGAT
ncbi:MAG: preprotein translocase subunit SecA [Planctomycetota bacterium]